jgi:hypothetical protein
MITLVEVRNTQGSLLNLPLDDASNGIFVQDIDGLHPVKATIVSSSFANLDEEQYQSSRRVTRDITLTLGLEPDYVTTTVSELRNQLYAYFMPKSSVNLRLHDSDSRIVTINGWVESCEAPLWSEDPEMVVVIRCLNSDFSDLIGSTVSGTTVSTTAETLVPYAGSVETGLQFSLYVNRALSTFEIYHRGPDNLMRSLSFSVSPALIAGDLLHINTNPGAKTAYVSRGDGDLPMLYAISPQSSWLKLLPGSNYFRVYATGAAIPFAIAYTNRYGGL